MLFERTDQADRGAAGRALRQLRHRCLAARRRALHHGQRRRDWTILPERFSKEPYGAYIRRDDQQWFDVVRWYTTALIEAEEQGVTRANAEEMRRTSVNPNTRRLLGVTPELGEALKLDRAWAYNVVRAIGQLRRDLRPHHRPRDQHRPAARAEPAVDRGRADLRPADAVT